MALALTPDLTQDQIDELIATRRDLHAHPELGLEERRTSEVVQRRLRALGLEPITGEGMAGTGVAALIEGAQPGKRVMLRADMDGLPVLEQNEVPYVSQNPGVMHACGHDGHVSILLAVAQQLLGRRQEMRGSVLLLFQPAEEGRGGGEAMAKGGLLERFGVDAAFGLHLWNGFPVGKVGCSAGPVMAAVGEFILTIRGRGGHGAMSHLSVDPVVAAAHVVTALQTIASREISARDSVVVTVGSIHGGTAWNVIPDEVRLEGTTRAFEPAIADSLQGRIDRVAGGVARALSATHELRYRQVTPATINHPEMAALAEQALVDALGRENVVPQEPTMGGEDFSYFLERAPGAFIFVGSANAERGLNYPHHHARFDFDERALPIGVKALTAVALRYLSS